jgi:hypothetical protein
VRLDGGTQQSSGGKIGGRTDSKPETKKAKKYHQGETKWSRAGKIGGQRGLDQRQQKLELTGEEHTAQRMEEQLQQGPAEGFMEGLGAVVNTGGGLDTI